MWLFIQWISTSYLYLWGRTHTKQSAFHTFKQQYQWLWSTDSQSHLAWAFIIKSCYPKDNIPRSHWPLGLIIETYCAVDGVERTVKVKTPLLEKANKQQFISYQNIAWNLPHWGGCHNRNIYVILVLFNCVSCTLVLVVCVIHT